MKIKVGNTNILEQWHKLEKQLRELGFNPELHIEKYKPNNEVPKKFIQVGSKEPCGVIQEVETKGERYRFSFSESEWIITEKINEILDYLEEKANENNLH